MTQLGKGSDQAPAIKKESQSASESPGGRVFRIKKKSQSAAESPGGRVFLIQTTESGVLPPRSPALEGRDRSARPGDRGTPTSPKNSKASGRGTYMKIKCKIK